MYRLGIVAVLIGLVSAAVGCSGAAKFLNQPLPEIVGQTARESLGTDYKILVDCTVKNSGAEGKVKVTAQVRNGGSWVKEVNIDLLEDETRLVTLEFPEATLLSAGFRGYRYACGTVSG